MGGESVKKKQYDRDFKISTVKMITIILNKFCIEKYMRFFNDLFMYFVFQ